MKQKFSVTGIACSACQAHVEKAVKHTEGVQDVQVNLLSNSMVVTYDQAAVSPETIIAAVQKAGYGAALPGKTEAKPQNGMAEQLKEMKRRLIVSFAFMIPLMYVSMGHMFGWPLPWFLHGDANAVTFAMVQLLLALPIVYVNRNYYQVGFKTLFHGAPNMDSLIAIGSAAAIVYGLFAIFRIGFGLGHGQMDVVHHYAMDLYFESAGSHDLNADHAGQIPGNAQQGQDGRSHSKADGPGPQDRHSGAGRTGAGDSAGGGRGGRHVFGAPRRQRAGGRRGGQRPFLHRARAR